MGEYKGFRDLLSDCKKKVKENPDTCKGCIFHDEEYCALYEIKIDNLKEDK